MVGGRREGGGRKGKSESQGEEGREYLHAVIGVVG